MCSFRGFATLLAMIVGLSGMVARFYLVIAGSVVRFIHFASSSGFTAFPRQVRLVYALCVIIALFDPSRIFCWALLVGTVAVTFFDRCIIVRVLLLMPWKKSVKRS